MPAKKDTDKQPDKQQDKLAKRAAALRENLRKRKASGTNKDKGTRDASDRAGKE